MTKERRNCKENASWSLNWIAFPFSVRDSIWISIQGSPSIPKNPNPTIVCWIECIASYCISSQLDHYCHCLARLCNVIKERKARHGDVVGLGLISPQEGLDGWNEGHRWLCLISTYLTVNSVMVMAVARVLISDWLGIGWPGVSNFGLWNWFLQRLHMYCINADLKNSY